MLDALVLWKIERRCTGTPQQKSFHHVYELSDEAIARLALALIETGLAVKEGSVQQSAFGGPYEMTSHRAWIDHEQNVRARYTNESKFFATFLLKVCPSAKDYDHAIETGSSAAEALQSMIKEPTREQTSAYRTPDVYAAFWIQFCPDMDFMQKEHWTNVKSTIMECLALGVVPIINENDSTNTAELRFGDNDNLAALTAVQLEADALCLFTDVSCVYTANPRTNPDAKPLHIVPEPWALRVETKDAGSGLGTGGMATKILAARTASVSGIPCVLLNSSFPKRLLGLLDFAPPEAPDEVKLPEEATYFMAMDCAQTVHDTRRWIVSLPVAGELTLDDGAARALGAKKSLLPAGVRQVQGTFMRNEAVRLCHAGSEVARGIVNFSSEQLSRILGKSSHEFEDLLGFSTCTEAIYRGNIILTTSVEALQAIEVVPRMRSSFSANQVTSLSRSDSMDSGMDP
ncbi:unnamed protein product [Symbiodinium sp. CCMP2592]|nr:unnamed protein product [Symbiodinium sp. CCMP2592]